MADKTVLIKLDVQEANANARLERLRLSTKDLKEGSEDYILVLKKIAIEEDKLSNIQQKRIKAQTGVTNVINKQKDATGSATAATMELSRVISDAPYGIRGMANNITQLVSQLGSASRSAGGLGAALKLMGSQLMGPLGVVFAITAAVSALDYFYGANKKAEKSVDDFTYSVGEGVTKLTALKESLDKGLLTQEESVRVIEQINKEYKGLNLSVDENNILTDDSVIAINNKIKALEDLAKAMALQKVLEEKYSELLPLQSKQLELDTNEKIKNAAAMNAISSSIKGSGTAVAEAAASSARSAAESNREAVKKIEDDISKLLVFAGEEGFLDDVFYGKKKGSKGKGRDKVFNFKYDFAGIEDDVKDAKKYLKAVADGLGIDMNKNPLEVDTDLDFNLTQETQDRLAEAMAQITKDKVFSSKLREYSDYAEQTKEVITAMSDFASAEFDRELTIEQNKTTALNNELNKRLLNENLSKDERKNIQNQIAQNDEKLRIKQEKIERKRFKMQKAANMATALIDTFRAAAGVMAEERGGFLQRLSAALPTIAFGMAQVASIARQKFQTSAGSSPRIGGGGGGASGASRAEPSFNIVGRSNENLLLGAIQSQFDQPLRAYVVARDVTNQQQMDGIISGEAST